MIWILGSALILAVTALVWLAIRGRADTDTAALDAPDAAVYRDQLKDIERDLARGVLAQEEAERARTEVARRLLASDARARTDLATGPKAAGVGIFALLGVGALALYAVIGAPGYPDMGLQSRIAMADELRSARPDQATREAALPAWVAPLEADPQYLKLVEELRTAVARRPDDLQGHTLLVRHEAALGNMRAARLAQERVIALKGDQQAGVDDWLTLAGLTIDAAGGFVTPEAEHALRQVLDRDPNNGPGQYYLGLMLIQTGRPDLGYRIWDRLVREGPLQAPWVQLILPQMDSLSVVAGVRWEPPAAATSPDSALPGPDADAVAAAEEMSAEERQAMIRGMVDQLNDRLATEGGSAAEWARLIGALGVLGDTDRARAIYAEARDTFGADPQALAQVEAAAERAGIAQ